MVNEVFFITTKFTDVKSGLESYGYRAFDYSGQTYNDNWPALPENDTTFLYMMVDEAKNNPDVDSMFQYLSEYELGCTVNGTKYSYEEIRVFLDKWSKHNDGWAD